MSGSNGVIFCGWSQSTSSAFKSYRLWREAQGSSLVVVYQSDNAGTTGYYDTAVQTGTNYYYKVDVVDAAGNVIGRSNIVALSCC
jgi:fibronectin type 3 domain-containing protein